MPSWESSFGGWVQVIKAGESDATRKAGFVLQETEVKAGIPYVLIASCYCEGLAAPLLDEIQSLPLMGSTGHPDMVMHPFHSANCTLCSESNLSPKFSAKQVA